MRYSINIGILFLFFIPLQGYLLNNQSRDELTRVTLPNTFATNSNNLTYYSNQTGLADEEIDTNIDDTSSENEHLSSSEEVGRQEDSSVSEEIDRTLPENDRHPKPVETIVTSHINKSFSNKKSFSCPKVKTDLLTGTFLGDLSPEDIKLIASMGDGIASGVGLFERKTDVEFRGASFASGGDANMDGLITIPNILREFSPRLQGESHGMGAAEVLSKQQLSVGTAGASTKDLPRQARELIRRLKEYYNTNDWVMVIIAVGTEEICATCGGPDEKAIREALSFLHSSLSRAFIVLLGPTHVSFTGRPTKNILKPRCNCSKDQPPGFMESVAEKWIEVFKRLQEEYDEKMTARQAIGLLALPQLTIQSRTPQMLFHEALPTLNRRGHSYMSKWLWNRLLTGERYNVSSAVLSSDSYYCPSSGCPYFRTTANMHKCEMLSLADSKNLQLLMQGDGVVVKRPRRTQRTLYSIAIAVVVIAFFVALITGAIFYQISKRGIRGRYDDVDPNIERREEEKPPRSPELVGSGHLTRQNAFNRQSTNSGQYLEVPSPAFGSTPKQSAATKVEKGGESTALLSDL